MIRNHNFLVVWIFAFIAIKVKRVKLLLQNFAVEYIKSQSAIAFLTKTFLKLVVNLQWMYLISQLKFRTWNFGNLFTHIYSKPNITDLGKKFLVKQLDRYLQWLFSSLINSVPISRYKVGHVSGAVFSRRRVTVITYYFN